MPNFIRVAAALLTLLAGPAFAQSFAQSTARPSPTRMAPPPVVAPSAPVATPSAPAAPVAPSAAAPAKPATISAVPSAADATARVDINAGTEAQLDARPGVGPARAKAIVAHRPYADLQDLVKKKVLSQGVFDGAKARMALANINTATAADLVKTLPGIGKVRSDKIVAGRPYATPQDLVTKGIVPQGVFDKVKDLIVS